jgi:hypothetical protein
VSVAGGGTDVDKVLEKTVGKPLSLFSPQIVLVSTSIFVTAFIARGA